jgi:hypothetical protein
MAFKKLKTAASVGAIALVVTGIVTDSIHRVDAQTNVTNAPANQPPLAFAGFATPEAAQESYIWTESTGNLEALLAACTPAQAERLRKKAEGKSADWIRTRLIEEAKIHAQCQITQIDSISGDEVHLHLHIGPDAGHPDGADAVQVMQRIGNEWKYAGKYGVDIKEKQ